MARLVNDNAIELLKERGIEVTSRVAKDNKEFFVLLKKKLLSDIQSMETATNFERKTDFLVDTYLDIREYLNYMDGILKTKGDSITNQINKRKSKTGEFTRRVVLEDPAPVEVKREIKTDYTEEVKEVLEYGEKNGYPSMVVGRNEKGQAYATMMPGKDIWVKKTSNLSNVGGGMTPSDEFLSLLDAVRKNDIHKEEIRP